MHRPAGVSQTILQQAYYAKAKRAFEDKYIDAVKTFMNPAFTARVRQLHHRNGGISRLPSGQCEDATGHHLFEQR